MNRVAGILCALIVAFSASAIESSTTLAQGDEFRSTIAEAVSMLDAERWREAYALFRRAHELRPSARTLLGLAKAALGLERFVEATDLFQQALDDSRSPLAGELRADAEQLLRRARAVVAHVRVEVNVDAAEILLDGSAIELGTARAIDPGTHQLVVRAPGYLEESRVVRVDVGEARTVDVLLRAEAATAPGPAERPTAEEERSATGGPGHGPMAPRSTDSEDAGHTAVVLGGGPDSGYLIPGGLSLGIGLVGLATGIVAGALREDAVDSFNASTVTVPPGCASDWGSDSHASDMCAIWRSRYNDLEPWLYVGFIGGGVLAAAGITLILVGVVSTESPERGTSFGCQPGLLSVECQLAF